MSISDFVLSILVIAGIGFVLWVIDINPVTDKLQVYNQTCTNMILDNTYCKGDWVDDPVITYAIDKDNNQVVQTTDGQIDTIQLSDCSITNRKNWKCTFEATVEEIQAVDGKIISENKGNKRQITRLEWLQNKILATITP